MKLAKAGKDGDQIREELAADTLVQITVVSKKFPKNDNDIIDEISWKKGVSKIVPTKDGKFGFAIIHELVGPEPKTLSDARGLITADYQNFLEQEWIKELKKKYTVTVNQDVLSQIK
jgi:peptidyl-prolyl cis-trans isomerase SurA